MKPKRFLGAFLPLLFVLLFSRAHSFGADQIIFRDDFEKGLRPVWGKVEFEGETQYRVLKEGTNSFLQGRAQAAASGLGVKIEPVDARGCMFSWKWKIDHVPPGGSETTKKTFDHTARLFVAFKTFIGPPRTINYVWANQARVGETFHHPSSGRSRFIVLKSGNAEAGKWFSEQRDLVKDWKLLFGDDTPPEIVGVGLMTDSDGTHSTVTGSYDDVTLLKRQ
jgi:hypothetical protein